MKTAMQLVEREAQLALLDETYQRVGAGEGAVVLVSGEAGIGKTAFVSAFTARLKAYARVLWGASDPLFTPRPLGPVYDIAVRDLPSLLDLLNSGAGWFSVAAAVQKILIDSPTPVILVFEDVHWADEATLDLVRYLGRRAYQTRTLLILTYREDEAGSRHPLRAVLGDLPARSTLRLALGPLTPQGVDEIARQMNLPPRGVYEITRGNPFFVTEVLRSRGDSAVESGLPPTVRDAVLARAAHLDPPARELLELASVFPGQAETWLIDAILAPMPSAFDACVESGFLLPGVEVLAWRHELARMAVEGSLPPGRAKDLHRRVFTALESATREISLARRVHHAAGAADALKVLEYAPRAAEQASAHGAHREAARYYQAAIRYRGRASTQEEARLLDGLSFESYLTGQMESAVQARLEAVELWRSAGQPLRVGDGLRWLSRLYWFLGSRTQADRYAAEAITALEPLPPGKELAMAYSNRSQLHMLAEEIGPAVEWGQKALELAGKLGETEITIHALTNIGTAEMIGGSPGGQAKLEQALELAQAHEMHDHAARCYANLTSRLVENRRYAAADPFLTEGLAYTTDFDMDSYGVYLRGWRARWFFEQGRWAEAAAWAQEVLRLLPGSAVMALPGITTLGHVLARQGQPGAGEWLDQARELASETGEFQRIQPVAVARAEAAWWEGRPQDVLDEIEPVRQLANASTGPFPLGALAYWLWRASGAKYWESQLPEAYQAMIQGHWRSAAEAWERIGCPFERALALAEGNAQAQRMALQIFEALGAKPAVKMLREKMAGKGLKGIPRGARPSTRANPEGLTVREMDILYLIEKGLSNAAIAEKLSISAKTVDHHVSAILGKLQARSRAEAASIAREKKIIEYRERKSPK